MGPIFVQKNPYKGSHFMKIVRQFMKIVRKNNPPHPKKNSKVTHF